MQISAQRSNTNHLDKKNLLLKNFGFQIPEGERVKFRQRT